jgi:hypothetical protein
MLVVPPCIDTLKAERILIAWKDSREARRALQDAFPLLHEAKSVAIVEVCDHSMEAPARQHVEDVAHYLGYRLDRPPQAWQSTASPTI